MLLKRFHRWQQQKLLRKHRIPMMLWKRVVDDALFHYQLDHRQLHALRELSSLFLQEKTISGAGGLVVDDYIATIVAAQACLLILGLDMGYYRGWKEVIIYPEVFIVSREQQDESGVIHTGKSILSGEAWRHGPVIIAWNDRMLTRKSHSYGDNVILHEFAHKLDMLNGIANGMPPLHPNMLIADWTKAFSEAYQDLQTELEHQAHHSLAINPYGAQSPAEFFAVVTESFFETPFELKQTYPELYKQLTLFYRQDTAP